MKYSYIISLNMNKFCDSKTCHELLDDFKKLNNKRSGNFLKFNDQGNFSSYFDEKSQITVYNPTKPFFENGKKVLMARVEPKHSEHSKVFLFEENENDEWYLTTPELHFNMQDPFYIKNIQGWKIIGGVRIKKRKDGILDYRTIFYRYKESIFELKENGRLKKPFAEGPIGMKDIRMIDLKNGKIAVFTRPQGRDAGRGKIGYIEINNLSELEDGISRARMIPNLFREGEWGGANDLMIIDDRNIGVFGHIAEYEGEIKHYYGMTFIFDRINFTAKNLKIVATAEDFDDHSPKKDDLGKVVFMGGASSHREKELDVYLGVGDVQSGKLRLINPFV